MTNQEISPIENYLTNSNSNKEFLTPKMLIKDPSCPFSEKALRFHIWKSGVNGGYSESMRTPIPVTSAGKLNLNLT